MKGVELPIRMIVILLILLIIAIISAIVISMIYGTSLPLLSQLGDLAGGGAA